MCEKNARAKASCWAHHHSPLFYFLANFYILHVVVISAKSTGITNQPTRKLSTATSSTRNSTYDKEEAPCLFFLVQDIEHRPKEKALILWGLRPLVHLHSATVNKRPLLVDPVVWQCHHEDLQGYPGSTGRAVWLLAYNDKPEVSRNRNWGHDNWPAKTSFTPTCGCLPQKHHDTG